MTAKETVLIVHGTFAAPVEGKPAWYEPGSVFCRQLDERLAARGSPARCWAHLDECGAELQRRAGRGTAYFSWSGHNSWIDRSAAAKQLWNEIEYLSKENGWECHVVAHSHGGNVVLEALDLDNPYRQGGLNSNFVLLGTPMLQFSSRTNQWLDRLEKFREYTTPSVRYSGPRGTMPGREATFLRMGIGVAVSVAIWALVASYFLKLVGLTPAALLFESFTFWTIAIAAVVVMAALYWWHRHIATKAIAIRNRLPAVREMFMAYPPRLLFINSKRDEAFGFLYGIRNAIPWPESPDLKTVQIRKGAKTSWLRAVTGQAEEAERQRYPWRGRRLSLWVASIVTAGLTLFPILDFLHLRWLLPYFASSFLIAGLLAALTIPGPLFLVVAVPWRIVDTGAFFIKSLVLRLASEYARRNVWSTLQEIALGISGSTHRLGDVSVELYPNPKFARGEFLYQDIAKTAEDAAVSARSRSFYSELEQIEEQSDADFWRLDKWRERIGTLASDPTLVHTVYYRHPDVIDQIANHLVRSAKELSAERFRSDAVESNTPLSWASWAGVAVDALTDDLASRDPVAARTLLDELRSVADKRKEAPLWEMWAMAVHKLIIDVGSRDPVAARGLLDDMRSVAEARNEAPLWEQWAKAAGDLMFLDASRDPVAARALLDDMRSVADKRKKVLLREMTMAALNVTNDLPSRDPVAARAAGASRGLKSGNRPSITRSSRGAGLAERHARRGDRA